MADIDEAIAAGRDATRDSAAMLRYLSGRFDDRTVRLIAPAVAKRLPFAAIVEDDIQGLGQTLKQRATALVCRE